VRDDFVYVDGRLADRPGRTVSVDADIKVDPAAVQYVGRGGRKLAAALDRFGLDPQGFRLADVGSGLGGFTDVLIQRGASRVIAIDVGHGQLAPGLRADWRVEVCEDTDVRRIAEIEPPIDAVVADLAFIRLRDVLSSLVRIAPEARWMVVLFKPQFELPGKSVPPSGVVRDNRQREAALGDFRSWLAETGFVEVASFLSPVPGVGGNRETFVELAPPWPAPN
jgi:23S rRNA (cytidine1920-2'-O)/16S rRNA (cytidine1409-2'-O)-methyltransferase